MEYSAETEKKFLSQAWAENNEPISHNFDRTTLQQLLHMQQFDKV